MISSGWAQKKCAISTCLFIPKQFAIKTWQSGKDQMFYFEWRERKTFVYLDAMFGVNLFFLNYVLQKVINCKHVVYKWPTLKLNSILTAELRDGNISEGILLLKSSAFMFSSLLQQFSLLSRTLLFNFYQQIVIKRKN